MCKLEIFYGLAVVAALVSLIGADANCTFTLSAPKGDITWDSSKIIQNTTCTWTFTNMTDNLFLVFSTVHIGLFSKMKITDGSGVVIREYLNEDSTEDGFITVVTVSNQSSIEVLIGSDSDGKVDSAQFTATYGKDCQQSLSGSGTIRTPDHPATGSAKASISCLYVLNVPPDSFANLVLSFRAFDFKEPKSFKVYKDLPLEKNLIKDLTATTTIPDDVFGPSKVVVKLMIKLNEKEKGFVASFVSTDLACGRVMNITKPTVLHAPYFPSNYTNNVDCIVVLQAPVGQTLVGTLMDLDLADEFDLLIINDGGRRIDPRIAEVKRGMQTGQSALSSGRNVWVRFLTDETQTGKGFKFQVMPQSPEMGGIRQGSGKIDIYNRTAVVNDTSVNYYLLTAKNNEQIVFNVTDRFLFPAAEIMCYNGGSETDPLIAKYSSDQLHYSPIFTTGSQMLVRVSNVEGRQYFKASYWPVKKGSYVYTPGRSGSFDLLPDVSAAEWFIDPMEGELMTVEVTRFRLPPNAYAVLYSGMDSTATPVLTMTAKNASVPKISLPAKKGALLQYTNPESVDSTANITSPTALSLSFQVREACSVNFTSPSGVVKSPNYPNTYPLNIQCTWRIKKMSRNLVYLSYTSFNLAPFHTLTSYNKQGNESSLAIGSFSNSTIPDDVIVDADELWLTLNTKSLDKSTEVGSGFRAVYETLACGGNITKLNSSLLETPGFPNALTNDTTCVWIITMPPKTGNTSVNILQFSYVIQNFNNYSGNTLEIRDGASSRAPEISISLQDGSSTSALSRYNVLWVKYTFKQDTAVNATQQQGFAFKMNYTKKECDLMNQCDKGLCMHSDWRCDGINQCMDGSDERGCAVPAGQTGISTTAFILSILGTFILAILLSFLIPYIIKRIRNPNYKELRDLMAPVPT